MNTKKIVFGGLFIALGVIFPQLFHFVGGPTAGKMFLPMHIPVLLAGFVAGPIVGVITGFLTPILSFLLTGMPGVPMLYLMLFELSAYGLFTGLFYQKLKLNVFISLVCGMLAGRVFYGLAIIILNQIFAMNLPKQITVIGAVVSGVPGIILQLLFVPAIILILERGRLIESNRNIKKQAS